MTLTDRLTAYAGGQLEVQNEQEGYLYRGEIERIELQGRELAVYFTWLAKGEGFPPGPSKWVLDPKKEYRASLEIYNVSDIGRDRMCLQSHIVGELVVLFPKGGSRLDPARVEGLEKNILDPL